MKMPHANRDGFGNVIRHFNQKIHNEHFNGHRSEAERERRHQADDFSLLDPKIAGNYLETNKSIEELECLLRQENRFPSDGIRCNKTWDSLLCWPSTPAGTTAFLPCFEEFNGIRYDASQNASKECFENGTWSSYANYDSCMPIHMGELEGSETNLTLVIYFIGYSVSLVALLVAMSIFLYFKDLRCLRNTIHTNLMFTYVMADSTWILTGILQNRLEADTTGCVILTLVLHYFLITTFFWMFVEGLYLYMLVVETFNRKNIKAHVYVSVGWGVPMILVSVWGIAKAVAPVQEEDAGPNDVSVALPHCHWMNASIYDWIFKVPILTVMALNSVFLVMIMWVLITKLRSANNAETQQYRKATKALMVLIPLLGITYILTIVSSTDGVVAQIFYNLRALMLSSQGFLVALFYCFLNSEVQNTVRHHMESWRTARALGGDRRYNYSKDWSPRSRTESIRLYSQPALTPYKKRESCASEVTTTTVVNSSLYNNNGLRVSNGTAAAAASASASSSGSSNVKVTTPFLTVTVSENEV